MVSRAPLYVMVGLFFMSLFGCREIHHYGYTNPSKDIFGGTLSVSVVGNYGREYESDGKKKMDWRFPYNLQFSYVVPKDQPLVKLRLKDIKITGVDTGNHYEFVAVESGKVRIYESDKLIRISIGPLTEDRFKYENYRVDLTAVIYKNESELVEKELSFLLETDYRTERRSDWFDEKTSI